MSQNTNDFDQGDIEQFTRTYDINESEQGKLFLSQFFQFVSDKVNQFLQDLNHRLQYLMAFDDKIHHLGLKSSQEKVQQVFKLQETLHFLSLQSKRKNIVQRLRKFSNIVSYYKQLIFNWEKLSQLQFEFIRYIDRKITYDELTKFIDICHMERFAGAELLNSFFDEDVLMNHQSSLKLAIRQYQRILVDWDDLQLSEEYNTINH